jgi:hypothetical protein
MRKLTSFFLLLFFSGLARSQNVYSALQLNAEREYKTKRPKKIIETNTFFNKSGKQVDKNIKIFDNAGMLLTEERYDEKGVMSARLTYTNDTVHRVTQSRTIERWTAFGYTKEIAFYTYDTRVFLVAITDKDANGDIIRQTNIVCNDKGHPVELSLFDGNGNSYGKETASYLYDKNRVVTAVLSTDGKVLSGDTIKISFTDASKFPGPHEVYNLQGDLTNWNSKNYNGSETIYEEEYTYDSFGNCTESRIYRISIKGNGKRKRENDRIFRKEYFY